MTMRVLTVLFLSLLIAGCTSQEKKSQAETASAALKPIERPTAPAFMSNPQEVASYLANHFWDKFDFRDTMYCHSKMTEQAFVDFLAVLPHSTQDKAFQAVKKLMTEAEADIVMYNYFFRQAEHYLYEPNSPMRNDELFIPFLEQVVESPKINETLKIRPKHLLELAYRNRVGSKANNVVYTMVSGKTGNLYDISAEFLILMFYNPGCKECQNTIETLKNSASITAAVSAGRLKILAVYPDKELKEWYDKMKDVPATWINGYDKALAVREKEIYDLKAIPTLYLLDKNKTVLFKDTSTGVLNDFFERNK